MADEWYYSRDKQQLGPVTRSRLGDLAAAGDLRPGDLVWRDGMAEWVAASRVQGLIPTAPPTAPTPPGAGQGGGTAWHVLAFVASGLLVLAFGVPWWGVSMSKGKAERVSHADALAESVIVSQSTNWLISYRGANSGGLYLELLLGRTASANIWAWHTLPGWLGLVAGLFAVATSATALAARPFRRWAWIALFVDAVAGLAVAVLAVVFLASCPTENVAALSQGFSAGPFAGLAGGVTLLVAGFTGGLVGVLRFAKAS